MTELVELPPDGSSSLARIIAVDVTKAATVSSDVEMA